MQEFLKAKDEHNPLTAFAVAFQASAWLFRQNPRVVLNNRDVRMYLPDFSSQMQMFWQQFRSVYGDSLSMETRDLVIDLGSEPCTQKLFYRKTLNCLLRGLDHARGEAIPSFHIQKDSIFFTFVCEGKKVYFEAPLDRAELSAGRIEAYEATLQEALQKMQASQNPHTKLHYYRIAALFLDACEEKLCLDDLEGLLFTFPDVLLCAPGREARVALIRQLGQILRKSGLAYPLNEEENLEGLLLLNLDALTARDGNQVLWLLAKSLILIPADTARQLAQTLWDRGAQEATDVEKKSWKSGLTDFVRELTAPQQVDFLKKACRQGLLDYESLGEALAQVKKKGSFAPHHLKQLAEMARHVFQLTVETKQPLQPPRTLQMLIWLIQRSTLQPGALEPWLKLFYSIAEQHSDRELVRLLGVQLMDQILFRAQQTRKSAAVSHCCKLGSLLTVNKQNAHHLPKIARLLASLPESERTHALYKQFETLTEAACRAGFPADVYRDILQPIRNIKVFELLKAKGELARKVMEKAGRLPENMQALVEELAQGPFLCVVQARFMVEQCQKRKMLKPSQHQELMNRICAALWKAIDDKEGHPEEIAEAFSLLKECFRHMPRDVRRTLFEKALRCFFVLADCNGYQALFDKEFPAFMELLDTELLDYTLASGAKNDLPPLLDVQFARLVLDQLPCHPELAPRLCAAALTRLEKIFHNQDRFNPFAHLQDRDLAKAQLCDIVQRMVFEATPAAWLTDQTGQEFQNRLQDYEKRLTRLHQQILERDLYLNPVRDFIIYLMLPKLEDDDEEEILPASGLAQKQVMEMIRGKLHPHAIRKLFEILSRNKAELEKSPEVMGELEALCASSRCQKIQGNDSDWDGTLKAIAALPENMQNNTSSRLLRLKLYRAFNIFLLANAAPQPDQRDEAAEVRWFKQALVCFLKATTLQIVSGQTPECHQTVRDILQDLQEGMQASSAIRQDPTCCSLLKSLIKV